MADPDSTTAHSAADAVEIAHDAPLDDAAIGALRTKYQPIARDQHAKAAASGSAQSGPPPKSYPEFTVRSAEELLAAGLTEDDKTGVGADSLLVCDDCHGTGMRQEQYNHIVMERTCVKCDGDGVVMRPGISAEDARAAAAEEAAKRAAEMAGAGAGAEAEADGVSIVARPATDEPEATVDGAGADVDGTAEPPLATH